MLSKELTKSQKRIADLILSQLENLGFSSNYEWKLNAQMMIL